MDLDQEYGKNRLSITKCRRYYNIIALFYIIVFGARVFMEVYSCFLGGSLFMLIVALLSAATLAAGYGGVYLHKDIFPIAAPLIALLHEAISSSVFPIVVPICFIFSVINILVNKKYRWLEQQDGFPYFNVRYRDQEIDKSQWNIKDPYTQSYEEIKKQENNNGQMDEL